jgi:hypothetical protein
MTHKGLQNLLFLLLWPHLLLLYPIPFTPRFDLTRCGSSELLRFTVPPEESSSWWFCSALYLYVQKGEEILRQTHTMLPHFLQIFTQLLPSQRDFLSKTTESSLPTHFYSQSLLSCSPKQISLIYNIFYLFCLSFVLSWEYTLQETWDYCNFFPLQISSATEVAGTRWTLIPICRTNETTQKTASKVRRWVQITVKILYIVEKWRKLRSIAPFKEWHTLQL